MKSIVNAALRRLGLQLGGNEVHAKTIADYNREVLVRQGEEQFKRLIEKGLSIPVALS